MTTTIGNDEKIIKSWDYAKVKGVVSTYGNSNLTVTDKRVIATTKSKHGISRTDISLNTITGISTSYHSGICIPLAILGIIMCLAMILLPLGIFILSKANGTSLTVVIDGCTPGEPVIASSSMKSSKRGKRVKIVVEKKIAEEIAEQLSTIIFIKH